MSLFPRTEKILKRTSIGVSIVVGTVDFLIVAFWAWFLVYFLVLKEDTLYSPGYSEARFEQVKVGMTEPQVMVLLGLPLKVIEESNGRHKCVVDYRDGVSPDDERFSCRLEAYLNLRVPSHGHLGDIDGVKLLKREVVQMLSLSPGAAGIPGKTVSPGRPGLGPKGSQTMPRRPSPGGLPQRRTDFPAQWMPARAGPR